MHTHTHARALAFGPAQSHLNSTEWLITQKGKRWGNSMTSSLGAGPALPRDSDQWQTRVIPAGQETGKKTLFVSYQNPTVTILAEPAAVPTCDCPRLLQTVFDTLGFQSIFSRHMQNAETDVCVYVSQQRVKKYGLCMQIYSQPTSVRIKRRLS